MITQSTFKIIQILLSEQVLYRWRRTKQETICRLDLVSSIIVPMQCYIHMRLMTLSGFWFLSFQPNYGDQSGMGVMSSGLGLGYDRGQYTSGHGPPHGMLRQKSIGEAVCFFRLPLCPPVRLSSGPVEVCAVLTCLSVAKNVLSVALNSKLWHFICRKKRYLFVLYYF